MPTTRIVFLDHRGKQLGENQQTTTLIRRGLLTKGLREAAIRRGVTVELGKRLTGVEVTPGSAVIARFEDGSEAHGDVLVGCDGIHSRTRRAILPQAPDPMYTGVIDSGAITRRLALPPSNGAMRMTFGLNGFFGYQVASSGEVYWFENFAQPEEPDRAALEALPDAAWQQTLLELHREDHAPIAEVIRATDEPIGRWPIYDLPSLPTWHRGPVGLIGDAAHATSPHVGQGASLAMEDALVLAKCLRDIPDAAAAFARFERLRKARVEAIVRAARRTGNQKAPANGFARWVRGLVLPFFLRMGVKQAGRIYSYRVDWNEKAA
jgi:2-polyprenyl-6-methoxyphenol hydroxylase-like FAD-dependent oxidoreductase